MGLVVLLLRLALVKVGKVGIPSPIHSLRWGVSIPEAERLAGRPAPSTVAAASEALSSCGFVLLRAEASATPLVRMDETCYALALLEVESILRRIASCGIDPRVESFSFAEIVHRSQLRYDVQLDRRAMPPSAPWVHIGEQASAYAVPIFEATCGEPVERSVEGLITSLAGAPDQRFHTDGAHQAFYAFVALADTEFGPEFQLGSHRARLETHRQPTGLGSDRGTAAADGSTAFERVRPSLAAGDILCYDYRTLHRGVANPSRDRPIFYQGWAALNAPVRGDGYNFGHRRLSDLERRMQLFPGVPQVPGQGVRV
jgi:hypothetical protein